MDKNEKGRNEDQPREKSKEEEQVEKALNELSSAILEQFTLSSELAAIDLSTVASMNKSVLDFHAALHERITVLLSTARTIQRQSNAAKPLTKRLNNLLQKAKQLEAIIDRLDEYTSKQEAALERTYSISPSK